MSPSGSDSNNGTASAPWATISHAANSVSAGATVHVAPGTYGNVVTSVSGTASARIRFVSDTQYGAKIVTSVDQAWLNSGNFVDIMGFDVGGGARIGIGNQGSSVRIIGNVVHNSNNSCTSNGGAGIDNENYNAADDDVIANIVHDIGPMPPGTCNTVQGIYHSNLRGHIVNNIVYRVSAWGIALWHAANAVTIANNLVFNCGGTNGGGVIIGAGDAPGGVTTDNTLLVNNIIRNNGGVSVEELGAIGTHNIYTDNILWQNAKSPSLITGVLQNTIAADPLMVNYQPDGSGNYQLQPTSRAINSGTTQGMPPNDFLGAPRPFGSGPDIGPYEFGATAPAWPWM